MPPLPEILGVKRVAFNWTSGGAPYAENVLHFSTTLTDSEAVGSAIEDNLTPAMFEAVSTDYTLTSLSITPLDGTSPTHEHDLSPGIGGDGTSSPVPATCQVIKFTTALRGRRNRGRVYLGPCGEGSQTNGKLVGAILTDVIPAWEAFQTALQALGTPINHVVASYKSATAHVVTGYHSDFFVHTQRRRQQRIG
jgi:hypothetical protein